MNRNLDKDIRHMLVKVCQKTYERHLVVGPGGNVSGRVGGQDKILISPTGAALVQLREDDFVCVNMDGKIISGNARPSSELGAHLMIYKQWPQYRFVLHTHPPTITGLSCGKKFNFSNFILTEDIPYYIKHLTVIENIPSSSAELATAIAAKVKAANAFILKNHGLMVAGRSASEALYLSELLEDCAKMYVVAKVCGSVNVIPKNKISALRNKPGIERYDDSRSF